MSTSFLTANWRNLIMANYIAAPASLLPYLPAGTELDYFNGQTYVSLVGFMFEQTKLLGMPIPFHRNFEEVNLRFYVRCKENGEWKRGVVFIKEIVPKPAITVIANTVYRERYQTLPMKHRITPSANKLHIEYNWKKNRKWNSLCATVQHTATALVPGSIEAFITEHYWGYSKYAANETVVYGVQHPVWDLYPVLDYSIDCDFAALYGPAFSILQTQQPVNVLVAAGSAITVQKKKPLELSAPAAMRD